MRFWNQAHWACQMPTSLFVIHPWPGQPQRHSLSVVLENKGIKPRVCYSAFLQPAQILETHYAAVSWNLRVLNERTKICQCPDERKIISNVETQASMGEMLGGGGQTILLPFWRCCFLTLRCPCSCLGCFWLPRTSSPSPGPAFRAKSSSRAQWILIKNGNGFPPSF